MRRNRGTILTLVIFALMQMGLVMFVLTGGSNAMLFEATGAHAQAVERSLIGSGLAWARARLSADVDLHSTDPVELDVAAFGLPDAKLIVRILSVRNGEAQVHIETSCHKGRCTLHTSRTFSVPGRAPARG